MVVVRDLNAWLLCQSGFHVKMWTQIISFSKQQRNTKDDTYIQSVSQKCILNINGCFLLNKTLILIVILSGKNIFFWYRYDYKMFIMIPINSDTSNTLC